MESTKAEKVHRHLLKPTGDAQFGLGQGILNDVCAMISLVHSILLDCKCFELKQCVK